MLYKMDIIAVYILGSKFWDLALFNQLQLLTLAVKYCSSCHGSELAGVGTLLKGVAYIKLAVREVWIQRHRKIQCNNKTTYLTTVYQSTGSLSFSKL